MDISRYLAALIKANRELIVPGLGTFHKEQFPARYDATSGTFLPPVEHIAFNTDFTEDNTLLNHIIQAEQADKKSAKDFLDEYINNLKDLLNTTEFIKIDTLGTFEKSGNSFLFEADETLKGYNPFFGLKAQQDTAAISNNTDQTDAEIEELDEEESKKGLGKKIAIAVLIILLGTLAAIQILNPQLLSALWKTSPAKQPIPPPVIEQNMPTATDSTLLADTIQSKTNIDTTAVQPPVSPDMITYEIIIAAFGKRSEANDFIKQLQNRGVTAHALPNRTKEYIKISVGTFTDRQLADTELKRIQTELSKGAWIYKVKPVKQKDNVSTPN